MFLEHAELNRQTICTNFLGLSDGRRLHYRIIDPSDSNPLFTVVTIPGLGEPIAKKDFELGSFLATQHARHIIYDPAGQGLSSRFLTDDKYQRAYVPKFTTYISDFNDLFEKIVQPHAKGNVLIYGHSTGGLVLLSWLAQKTPKTVSAAIVSAPALVLKIPAQTIAGRAKVQIPLSVVFSIAACFVAGGKGTDYVWGAHDYKSGLQDPPLTHDRKRLDWLENYFANNPAEMTGGATWNWFYQTLKRGYTMRLGGELKRVSTPLLALLSGEDHLIVSDTIAKEMRQMPNSEIVTIKGAYHEVMNEAEPYRSQAMDVFRKFLMRHAL